MGVIGGTLWDMGVIGGGTLGFIGSGTLWVLFGKGDTMGMGVIWGGGGDTMGLLGRGALWVLLGGPGGGRKTIGNVCLIC